LRAANNQRLLSVYARDGKAAAFCYAPRRSLTGGDQNANKPSSADLFKLRVKCVLLALSSKKHATPDFIYDEGLHEKCLCKSRAAGDVMESAHHTL
jgi:hypothetical protein